MPDTGGLNKGQQKIWTPGTRRSEKWEAGDLFAGHRSSEYGAEKDLDAGQQEI
jgi:hypothetical protein